MDPNLIVYTDPDSYEAEQFRMLRTSVLFPKSGNIARSIMIASTAPAEGKSFVAANLAISIAQNIDKHVLLIDCDMRNPSIHKLFGYGSVPGLSDYLTQGEPLPSLIRKTLIERLSILPGGPIPPNPAELLTSGRMTDLLKEVTQRYNDRFIIIDTPPIQLTAEARALAKFSDGVLLVVRFGSSSKELAADVIEKIGQDRLIGVVGNFANRQSVYKNYADKYSSYYRRGRKGKKR
jgi:exopolysaccharide/PEP-CTERM locus tyrosine autokinase